MKLWKANNTIIIKRKIKKNYQGLDTHLRRAPALSSPCSAIVFGWHIVWTVFHHCCPPCRILIRKMSICLWTSLTSLERHKDAKDAKTLRLWWVRYIVFERHILSLKDHEHPLKISNISVEFFFRCLFFHTTVFTFSLVSFEHNQNILNVPILMYNHNKNSTTPAHLTQSSTILVMFWPVLAQKPRLWLLRELGQAKAPTHGLSLARLGLSRSFWQRR